MHTQMYSRRELLRRSACGFGGVALNALLAQSGRSAPANSRANSPAPIDSSSQSSSSSIAPHFRPKAKRAIFLFMAGGPSQQDLFHEKPYIAKMHGQTIRPPVDGREVSVGIDKYLALGPGVPIRPRGDSGITVSDLMPHFASIVDDVCLLRAVNTDNEAHAPATLQLHTGVSIDVRPSMGAWFSYGLGNENDNLPSFISIHAPSDVRTYGAGFLPAIHQGTPIKVPSTPKDMAIKHLVDPQTPIDQQRRRLDFIQRLNRRLAAKSSSDQQMEGMIDAFELAFRMQTETPRLVDLSSEPRPVHEAYGIGKKETDRNGRACLLARRLSEAGVRFVQVTIDGWDHHDNIRDALPRLCNGSDQPVSALIKDLKTRGLLDDTLVVWSGEFGRTPWSQDLSGKNPIDKHGREHQPESFCAWMAGGGVRSGLVFGETDDFGYRPVADSVHLHDLHATMLHLLGVDHERLTYRHLGRDYRLTDVYGRVVTEILA